MGDINNIYKAIKDESTMLYEDDNPQNPTIQNTDIIDEPNLLNDCFTEPQESEPFSFTILTLILLMMFSGLFLLVNMLNQ